MGFRRIRRNKLREQQYREEYAKCFESKRVEWNEDSNVEHMWAVVDSAREKCSSLRDGGERTQRMWWNDVVEPAIERMELLGG